MTFEPYNPLPDCLTCCNLSAIIAQQITDLKGIIVLLRHKKIYVSMYQHMRLLDNTHYKYTLHMSNIFALA